MTLLGLMQTSSVWSAVTEVRVSTAAESAFVGEPFNFQVAVSTSGDTPPKPKIPSFPGILIGPRGNPDQGIFNDNGKVTITTTYHYMAQASSTGPATLSGISAGNVVGNPVTVQVVERGTKRESSPLFVRAEVSQTEVWQGEQILFDYSLYIGPKVTGGPDGRLSVPNLNDALKSFITEEVGVRSEQKSTIYEGQQFTRALLLRRVLFPLSPGDYEIPPIRLEGRWEAPRDPRDRDPFRSFFGPPGVEIDRIAGVPVASQPIQIKVKPLPTEGRPPGFSSTVGNYTFGAELDRNEVQVGEPVTLSLTVSGDGNLDSISEPNLNLPPSIEKYDTERTPKKTFNAAQNRLQGTVRYDFILIPREEGEIILKPFEFHYFDPRNGKFLTLEQGPFRLKVKPDEGGGVTYLQGKRKRIRVTGTDFRHIRPASSIDFSEDGPPAERTLTYWSSLFVPWFLLAGVVARKKRKEFLEKNPDVAAKIRTRGEVKTLLHKAEQLVATGGDGFYGALENAIHDHLTAQLTLSTRGLTHAQLRQTLLEGKSERGGRNRSRRGLQEADAEACLSLLQRLEGLRYAPTTSGSEQNSILLEETRALLGRIGG